MQKLLQKLNCSLPVQPSTTKLEVDKTLIWKGSTFTLTCTVEGYPPPERPTLQKGQTNIAFTSCDGGTNKKVSVMKGLNFKMLLASKKRSAFVPFRRSSSRLLSS